MVIARTTEGDVGILPNHAPLLSSIIEGVVDVQTAEGETWIAAVDAGFLSVADNRVSILAERAEMSHEIDLEKAREELERDLAAVGFGRLHVFRPSMLLGDRAERQPLERLLIGTFRAINPLFAGPADRFRGVEAADLARAMVAAATSTAGAAVNAYHWRDIVRLAGRS